jgi:hypothetical protein
VEIGSRSRIAAVERSVTAHDLLTEALNVMEGSLPRVLNAGG